MIKRYAIAFAVLAVSLAGATAETYPSKLVTIVVPFAAGGPLDTRARFLAERMRPSLGQLVIIENVAGAGGSLGTGRVARAAPDGYTVGIGIWSTHVVNGAINALQYDVLNDFEPVVLLTNNSQLIVGKKTLPPGDLKELIAWLKANPEQVLAGTAGVGSPQHIFGLQFQNATDTRFGFVHYRGGIQATQDLVAGQIDLVVADLTTSLPRCALATSRLMRSPAVAVWRLHQKSRQQTRRDWRGSTLRSGARFGLLKARRRILSRSSMQPSSRF
jgi:tripartite-type tricarboxylate transporter receptor subunit TctC